MHANRMILAMLLAFAPAAAAAGDAEDAGDAPKPGLLTKETFFDMESVSSPRISPDGKRVLFARSRVDRVKDRAASSLWLVDVEDGRLRELTGGSLGRDTSPAWSPDGKRLAFLSEREGATQVHVMWLDTRETAQLTNVEKTPGDLAWSPDGRWLAFTMEVPEKEPPLKVKLPEKPEGAQWAKGAVLVDRLTWARDGSGPIPRGWRHAFVVDARAGGTPRQVTTGKYDHQSPEWSADGKELYVAAIRKPDAEYLRGDTEVHAFPLDGGEPRALTDRAGPDRFPSASPDGKWIAYTGYDERRATHHLASLYVMDADGGRRRLWVGDLPDSPREVTWADDSSGVTYLVRERGSANLWFAPLEGSPRRVTEGVQVLDGFSVARDGTIAAVRSTPREPGRLVVIPPGGSNGSARVLVDVNEDVLRGVRLGEVEELWATSADGLRIQGWLVKPPDFDPAKKYPMLLWIHGGPWSMYDVGFSWPWQNFAALGTVVLYLNPRGSTGYGQEFVNGIQHAYPGKDHDDLMAGVDAAVARGFVDERNLFVCGGSGGGVLTAWIVGHTDRFAAAVSMRPVINWHSFVGTTDGTMWYDQFRKLPWEDPMEYALRSPLHYVANVKTPTMVMTGEADLRTPISQSEEYYRALKLLKKETLLVRMPEEYHGWRRPSHQLLQQLYLQAWFDKHRRK